MSRSLILFADRQRSSCLEEGGEGGLCGEGGAAQTGVLRKSTAKDDERFPCDEKMRDRTLCIGVYRVPYNQFKIGLKKNQK